jgi:hypothetical protein
MFCSIDELSPVVVIVYRYYHYCHVSRHKIPYGNLKKKHTVSNIICCHHQSNKCSSRLIGHPDGLKSFFFVVPVWDIDLNSLSCIYNNYLRSCCLFRPNPMFLQIDPSIIVLLRYYTSCYAHKLCINNIIIRLLELIIIK